MVGVERSLQVQEYNGQRPWPEVYKNERRTDSASSLLLVVFDDIKIVFLHLQHLAYSYCLQDCYVHLHLIRLTRLDPNSSNSLTTSPNLAPYSQSK